MQDPTATLTNPIKPSCKQPDVAFKGSMVYWYNSTSWRDDMAWAASWMYRASGDPNYLSDAYGFYRTHKDLEGQLDIRYLVRSSLLCCFSLELHPVLKIVRAEKHGALCAALGPQKTCSVVRAACMQAHLRPCPGGPHVTTFCPAVCRVAES